VGARRFLRRRQLTSPGIFYLGYHASRRENSDGAFALQRMRKPGRFACEDVSKMRALSPGEWKLGEIALALAIVGVILLMVRQCSMAADEIKSRIPAGASVQGAFEKAVDQRVVDDSIRQYEIAKRSGTKMDTCVHAGFVFCCLHPGKGRGLLQEVESDRKGRLFQGWSLTVVRPSGGPRRPSPRPVERLAVQLQARRLIDVSILHDVLRRDCQLQW